MKKHLKFYTGATILIDGTEYCVTERYTDDLGIWHIDLSAEQSVEPTKKNGKYL